MKRSGAGSASATHNGTGAASFRACACSVPMIKSPIRSQIDTPRNASSVASCLIKSCVSGNSAARSSPRYRMLIAKCASSAAFASLDGRRLMPKREHVTCSEPTVTPINAAISSRCLPRSTRFLICAMRSGVNLTRRPRLRSWTISSIFSFILCCVRAMGTNIPDDRSRTSDGQFRATSHEHEIPGMQRGMVRKRNRLVVAIEAGMDLPLVGTADLADGRALRLGAEAAEHQEIPLAHLVVVEVGNGRAVGAAGGELEYIVAGTANQSVRAEGHQPVVTAVAGTG